MLGEFIGPHEFEERHLFDRFLERSRVSSVPEDFYKAHHKVAKMVAPWLSPKYYTGQDGAPAFMEIGFRLVQREFPTPHLAFYAMLYGTTVSYFKTWDNLHQAADILRGESTKERAARQAGEVRLELPQVERVEASIRELAELTARIILAQEAGWMLEQSPTERAVSRALNARRLSTRKPTAADLKDVRDYIEDYFTHPQHRARITLLAQG